MTYQIGDKLRRTTDSESTLHDTQKDGVYEVLKLDDVRLSGCCGVYTEPYLNANFTVINPVVTSVPTNEGFDLVLRREEDVATYSAGGFTGTYAEPTERANGRKGYIVVLDYLKTIADAHGLLEEAKVELAEGVHRWDTAEGVVYVKLVSSREGRPMLRAVQPDGTEVESGCIFTFDSRHIYRNMGINSTVQIPRDGSRVNMETTL